MLIFYNKLHISALFSFFLFSNKIVNKLTIPKYRNVSNSFCNWMKMFAYDIRDNMILLLIFQ